MKIKGTGSVARGPHCTGPSVGRMRSDCIIRQRRGGRVGGGAGKRNASYNEGKTKGRVKEQKDTKINK